MKAIRIERALAAPSVTASSPTSTRRQPGAGEIRVKHEAIGVNFIDTYHRTGLYKIALPSGLGQEAAGVVDAIGEGVTRFEQGDRVAYCIGPARRVCGSARRDEQIAR